MHIIFPIVVVIRRETEYVPSLEDEEVYKTICSLPVGRSSQVGKEMLKDKCLIVRVGKIALVATV